MTGTVRSLNLEAYSESLYPLYRFGWSDLHALRAGRFKVIAAPRPELYDLQQDPFEEHNVFETRRALGERMIARLHDLEASSTSSTPGQSRSDVDADTAAKLAALGYVGRSGVQPSDQTPAGSQTPRIRLVRWIREIVHDAENHRSGVSARARGNMHATATRPPADSDSARAYSCQSRDQRPALMQPGESRQFSATATLSDRTTRDITATAVWRTSNSSVFSRDAAASSRRSTAGERLIAVSYQNRSATLVHRQSSERDGHPHGHRQGSHLSDRRARGSRSSADRLRENPR